MYSARPQTTAYDLHSRSTPLPQSIFLDRNSSINKRGRLLTLGALGCLIGKVLHTGVDGVRDTASNGASQALQVLRDLRDDGVGQLLGSSLLLSQVVVGLRALAGLDDEALLAVQLVDDGRDLVLEVVDGAGESQGVTAAKGGRAADLSVAVVDGRHQSVGGLLDLGDVATVVSLDSGAQGVDLGANAGKDAGDGGEVALLNRGGRSEGAGGEAEGEDGDDGELHDDG